MVTADSVKANLQRIIEKANSTTGRTDTTVDSAVDALIAGFGKGGGSTPSAEQISVVRTVTVPSDVTGAQTVHPLLTGDEFIKKHYADEGFSATLIPLTPVASGANVVHFNYQGNRNIGSSDSPRTGLGYRSSSASAVGMAGLSTAINDSGYGQHMRVDSSGNLYQYLATDYILKAGTYIIVLTCTES